MNALPRCAPSLESAQVGQSAVLQQLQQLQGTGMHVHQALVEPSVAARMTLDDLAARHQLSGGSLLEAQQSSGNVHQTAV